MKIQKLLVAFLLISLSIGCSTDSTSDGSSEPTIDKSGNLKALGASAEELLSDIKFTSITIEMVYVTGFKPSQKTIDNLKSFLNTRTFKPDGVTISTRAIASSSLAPFTIQEIANIEKEERLVYNAGDEIAVFIYFADGSNEDDTDNKVVLGSAYRNTSMVIYSKTIENVAARANAPEKSTIESTVVNHEFGHLFGLVDVGSPMQTDHKDSPEGSHCNVDGCLMTANVQIGGPLIDMIGSTVPDLDSFCIQDLQANGGK
ncbi:hypothetical protein L1I30_04685 [Gillisia sp. M10.2A]|uniref:Membrane metalloprotease n=1 Tax=Gillisia lutea TaxID=2909668 RepID=A0ABS9EFB5_9FLAO|nr:hypothetical protein [Gillisia lutea]MCF4100957.1 hypothetical protein [Gillisia lutea]